MKDRLKGLRHQTPEISPEGKLVAEETLESELGAPGVGAERVQPLELKSGNLGFFRHTFCIWGMHGRSIFMNGEAV